MEYNCHLIYKKEGLVQRFFNARFQTFNMLDNSQEHLIKDACDWLSISVFTGPLLLFYKIWLESIG